MLLRRGYSLTAARKIPIVGGMLLSMSIIGCNYVQADAVVVGLMALAFFGKASGRSAGPSCPTPRRVRAAACRAACSTPSATPQASPPRSPSLHRAIDGLVQRRLIFVGLNALVACFCYLVVVGEIRRVELKGV